MKRLCLLGALLLLLLAPAALAGGRRASITIRDFSFGPSVLHVRRGTTVFVLNRDATVHSFTSISGRFELSALRAQGGSGHVRFAHAGTYHYFCAFHPYMRGTIVVR